MATPPGESGAGARRSVRVTTLLGVLAATMRGAGSSPVSLCADSWYQCLVPTDPSARRGQDSPFSCSRVGLPAHDRLCLLRPTVEVKGDRIVFPSRFTGPEGEVELEAIWVRHGNDAYEVTHRWRTATGWEKMWTMELRR